nr:alpha/beta fold hydrolase [uncultured Sphaerochaeta sp.]
MEPVLVPSMDGFFLSCMLYGVENPKGLVQIIHGAAEHKGRYHEVASILQAAGYCTLVSDLRGHGESIDSRFVRGYMPPIRVLVEDQYKISCFLMDLHPGVPLHMLGHSLGSNIARLYLGSHDGQLSSLVMTGCPFHVPGIMFGKAFVRILMLLLSEHGYGFISSKLTTSASLKWVCSDPSVIEERRSDPYRKNYRYQLASIHTIFDSVQKLHAWKLYACTNPTLPILCITGSDDPVPGGAAGLADTKHSLHRIGYTQVESKVFDGMRHEVLMEVDKQDVFDLVLSFLEHPGHNRTT